MPCRIIAPMEQTPKTSPRQRERLRIAVVTMGVKLGDETRGYTRFRFIAQMLAEHGFDVDLITSSFQHWEKAHRDVTKACYRDLPYNVVFIDEPGYKRNLDLGRIRSHSVAAKNMRAHFEASRGRYALIYAEIPPNDVARACAEAARDEGIPFVVDVNDLWPEAMRMAFEAMTAGTPHEGATLELVEEPLGLRCSLCGHVFHPEDRNALYAPCPACGDTVPFSITEGEGIFLDHLEAE